MRHEACELEEKDYVLQCKSVCLALCDSQKAVVVMLKCLSCFFFQFACFGGVRGLLLGGFDSLLLVHNICSTWKPFRNDAEDGSDKVTTS